MNCRSVFCSFIILAMLLSGCTNIEVFSKNGETSNKNGKLNGIPFYIKVPALTQDTKLLKNELSLQIDITYEVNGTKQVTHYPTLGPIMLSNTKEARNLVVSSVEELVRKGKEEGWPLKKSEEEVTKVINILRSYSPSNPVAPMLVSNTWGISMVVSPRQYYISNRVPLFGTASSSFKFSGDGTLTEATSAITDDTAKTLLGLFPISAKLSNQWGITKPAGAMAVTGTVQIDGRLAQVKTLYSLRQVTMIGVTDAESLASLPPTKSMPPLALEDANDGTRNVQLVSIEVQTDSAKPKGDSKTYQIQGSITPPEMNQSSASGGSGAQEMAK